METRYQVGDKVRTHHNGRFVEGEVREGPNSLDQYRCSVPGDRLGYYKSVDQMIPVPSGNPLPQEPPQGAPTELYGST